MTIKLNAGWMLFLLYVVAGFGTFGWTWNDYKGRDMCFQNDKGEQVNCFTEYDEERQWQPVIKGMTWPIYWGGVKAIELTKH